MCQKKNDATVRSIFISDLHLGNRFSKASELLEFLQCHRPENLYLVGDFIDAWALRRRWYWPQPYDALFNYLGELVESGTNLFYTPGNHDSFLRRFQVDEPPVRIQDQFEHRCADGRRMVVLHGDQFDSVESGIQWLSVIGALCYDVILYADRAINRLLSTIGLSPRRISATIKQTTKKAVQYFSGFERQLLDHARQERCDVIICGHIHVPGYRMLDEILYVNLGDWIENTTALVEYGDGRLELLETTSSTRASLLTLERYADPASQMVALTPMAIQLAHQLLSTVLDEEETTPVALANVASSMNAERAVA